MKRYIIYTASMLILSWSCHPNKTDSHEGHDHGEHAEPEGHTHSGDEIILTTAQAKLLDIQTEEVQRRPFHQVIRTSGQIVAAQGEERTVAATISGIVSYTKAGVNEGEPVARGESLFSIYAGKMADGDPVTKAQSTYEIAWREFDRAEALIENKLISQKEYNEIKLTYTNAKIAYDAIAAGRQGGGAVVASPIGGYIKTKLVAEGQFVNVGDPLIVVTQNNKLQLRADVSERHYKDLQGIRSANFLTGYDDTIYQLSEMNGQLLSYGRSSNAGENFIPVSFRFDNVGNIFPGAYVEVFLLSGQREGVISVPRGALTDESGNFFVYRKLCDEEYERCAVQIGASDGSRVEVISGLHEGDRVVTQGAYYVKLAAASGEIPHGHVH